MKKKNIKTLFGITSHNLPYLDLDGKYKSSWTEDSFFFTKNTDRQVAVPQSKNYIGSSFTAKKKKIFLIISATIFGILIARVFLLQIIEGEKYLALAETNRQRTLPIPSERGLIYDRNGVQMTKNIPKFSLAVIPQDLPRDSEELDFIIERLSKLINKDKEEISDVIEQYSSYSYESVDIVDDLDYETALAIQIETNELPGLTIQKRSKRLYEWQDFIEGEEKLLSMSHVLGYAGKLNRQELEHFYPSGYLPTDSIGKTGIEKSFEKELRGIYGYERIEVDAYGKKQGTLAELAPQHGLNLYLTIDTEIQNKLEKIIIDHLKKENKTKAAAIAMNPNNGQIMALISLPAFDNNDFSGGIKQEKYDNYLANKDNPLFNRAISGTYPSGSTIKMAIAAAALQEKIITEFTSFLSTGGIYVGSWYFKDWQIGGHGQTDVKKSLARSVNTFYYYIGGGYGNFVGLGHTKIVEYLKKFGFADKLGIDLPAEATGFLPSKEWKEKIKNEKWYIGDTYNLSIGQGDILVTPLQIAAMTASVANGGMLYKPQMLLQTFNPNTKEKQKIEKIVLNQNFIDTGYINTIRWGMRDCVIYGSCRSLSTLPITVAGKTGTAQWNSNKENHAWFTSFAPFYNPEIVLTVLVEEGEEGSGISARIANDFYAWWANYR